jgi:ribosomal protein L25 (general stress protein Ctc)
MCKINGKIPAIIYPIIKNKKQNKKIRIQGLAPRECHLEHPIVTAASNP